MKKIIGFLCVSVIAVCGVLALGKAAVTEAAESETVITLEDVTDSNLIELWNTYGDYYECGLYETSDLSEYYIVTDGGDNIYELDNSDYEIESIDFMTSCYENDVVYAMNSDWEVTLLNYDGSYYAGLDGYYEEVSLSDVGSTMEGLGYYYVYDGTDTIFYNDSGEELFSIEGYPCITWQIIDGYNAISGEIGDTEYSGIYDDNLNLVYDGTYCESDSGFVILTDTEADCYDLTGTKVLTIPGAYDYVEWCEFGDNYFISAYVEDGDDYLYTYNGIYDSNLTAIYENLDSDAYLLVMDDYLIELVFDEETEEFTMNLYDTDLQEVDLTSDDDADLSDVDELESLLSLIEEYLDDYIIITDFTSDDGTVYYEGMKFDLDTFECVYALLDDELNEIYSGFEKVYMNGMVAVEDESTGYLKLSNFVFTTVNGDTITDISSDGKTKTGEISVEGVFSGETLTVGLSCKDSAIPDGSRLEVSTLSEGDDDYDTATDLLSDISDKFEVFDITLLNSANYKIQPDGKVTISITIPSDFDSSNLKVYRLEDDGTLTDMDATVDGENVEFTTTHFSTYILAEADLVESDDSDTAESTSDTTIESVQTGDSQNIMMFSGMIIAALGAGGICLVRKNNVEI